MKDSDNYLKFIKKLIKLDGIYEFTGASIKFSDASEPTFELEFLDEYLDKKIKK